MPLGKQYAGMWTLSQQLQAVSGRTWTGIPAVPSMWAWGRGQDGQLGINAVGFRSSPVQVDSGISWPRIAAVEFAGGIKGDGTLWMWGDGVSGHMGNNSIAPRSSPTQVGTDTDWAAINVGASFIGAVKTNGTAWVWGQNNAGYLGLNNTIGAGRSSPTQLGALTNWVKIQFFSNSAVALKTDGTLWSWGHNPNGQLGTNNTVYRSSPVQIGSDTDWSNIAGSFSSPIAQKTNGAIYSWGSNGGGNLGLNTSDGAHKSSPTQIGSATDWILAENALSSGKSNLLRKTNGTLWGFGYNNYGMLGAISVVQISSPVQIGALTTWSSVAVTSNTGLAVKTDGTLWASGNGADYGQLGNNLSGATNYRSSPVQIGTGTQWTDVYAGFQTVYAIQEIPGT
jgi:alpha-tubulin suppressor-like RCC1 family protein